MYGLWLLSNNKNYNARITCLTIFDRAKVDACKMLYNTPKGVFLTFQRC